MIERLRSWWEWHFGFSLRVRRVLRAMDNLMDYDLAKRYGHGWEPTRELELTVIGVHGERYMILGTPGRHKGKDAGRKG